MPRLRLQSPNDTIDLDEISGTGIGVEALSGVTGLGLPPVMLQWIEGAGDGAIYRGERIQPREIDIPLYILARDREHLQQLHSRVNRMLTSRQLVLRFVEDDGTSWRLDVHRVGGGVYAYGIDTRGENELRTVVTLRAGDPFWTYSEPVQKLIGTENAGRGLLKGNTSLSKLRLSGSTASGQILFENEGDAPAYPTWTVRGPIAPVDENPAFRAIGPDGRGFEYWGEVAEGEVLVIDSRRATVTLEGVNAYADLGTTPLFWPIPPGQSFAHIEAFGTTSETRIIVSWYPRKWAVI